MKIRLIGKAVRFVAKNNTKILAGLAVVGTIVTPILASKATIKAKEELEKLEEEIIEEEKKTEAEEHKDPTNWQKFKRTAPLYFWTVVSGTGTIICILYGEKIHVVKLAESVMLSEFWEYRYKNLDRKFAEKCGREMVNQSKKEIAKEINTCEKIYQDTGETRIVVEDSNGDKGAFRRVDREAPIIIYDRICDDYNTTTMQDLSIACMRLNQEFSGRYYYDRVDWNRFRSFLGWKAHPEGKKWSWDGADDDLMEVMQYNGDSWIDVGIGDDGGVDAWTNPKTGKKFKALSLWFNYGPQPIVRD